MSLFIASFTPSIQASKNPELIEFKDVSNKNIKKALVGHLFFL